MSGPDVRYAARIKDKITHSMAPVGQIAGAAIGCIIGIALTATGVGAATIIPLTVGGASLGKALADEFAPAAECGEIAVGAKTVFYGPDRRNAAYVGHTVKCSGPMGSSSKENTKAKEMLTPKLGPNQSRSTPSSGGGGHGGEKLDEGSSTVFVELQRASRVAERTNYGGAIKTGIESVEIGGDTVGRTPRSQQMSPDQAALDWFFWGLDWAGTFVNPSLGGMFIASLMLKQLGQVSERELGKQSTVTMTIKALDTLLSLSKVAKSPKDVKQLKELIRDAAIDPDKKKDLLKKGTDLIKSGAKVEKDSPNYVEKVTSGRYDELKQDKTKDDVPTDPD